jgi:hypothetical protein
MSDTDRIRELENHVTDLEKKFNDYILDKEKEESKKLRTALIWAGGMILILGSFIFSEFILPLIKVGRP